MDGLLKAINHRLAEGTAPTFDPELLDSSDKPHIHLTLKNYSGFKLEGGGLSAKIFAAGPDTEFKVVGPMGKGLGLSS